MKPLLFLTTAIIVTLFSSCDDKNDPENSQHDSDAFVGTWKPFPVVENSHDYLVITKIDDKTISIKYVYVWGQENSDDRTWIADVSGVNFVSAAQNGFSTIGNLFSENVIYIAYDYISDPADDHAPPQKYTRVEDPSSIPAVVKVYLKGSMWRCTSGSPWPNNTEYFDVIFYEPSDRLPYFILLAKVVGQPLYQLPVLTGWQFYSYTNTVWFYTQYSEDGIDLKGLISDDGKTMTAVGRLNGASGTYHLVKQ